MATGSQATIHREVTLRHVPCGFARVVSLLANYVGKRNHWVSLGLVRITDLTSRLVSPTRSLPKAPIWSKRELGKMWVFNLVVGSCGLSKRTSKASDRQVQNGPCSFFDTKVSHNQNPVVKWSTQNHVRN